jgi:hypothetical protein
MSTTDPGQTRPSARERASVDLSYDGEAASEGYVLFAGVMLAMLGALNLIDGIAQMMFISAYPFWSLALFALNILVIYCLVAHGARTSRA